MPGWILKLLPAFKKIPWKKVIAVAIWAYTAGKRRLVKNLTEKEFDEFTDLFERVLKLSGDERVRFRQLLYKGLTGD